MKIFYQNYIIDKGVDGNNPIQLSLEQTLEIFENLQSEEDNFLGLVDDYEKCIQFVNEGAEFIGKNCPKELKGENMKVSTEVIN